MTAIVGPWAGRHADKKSPRLIYASHEAFAAGHPEAQQSVVPGLGCFSRRIIGKSSLTFSGAYRPGAALLSSARQVGQALGAILVGAAYVGTQQPSTVTAENNGLLELLSSVTALQIGSLSLGILVWFFLPHGLLQTSPDLNGSTLPDASPIFARAEPPEDSGSGEAIGPSMRPDSNR